MSFLIRKCCVCNVEKELTANFHKSKHQSLGHVYKCKECCSSSRKKYYKENKKKENERNNTWYAENSERKKLKGYAWVEKNKDKRNRIYHKWEVKKVNSDSMFRKKRTIGSAIRNAVCIQHFSKRLEGIVGCDYNTFISVLGPMPKGYTLDHICPFSQAQNEEELLKLFHYSNCQWLTMEDNYKKFNFKTEKGEELCRKLLGREWIEVQS